MMEYFIEELCKRKIDKACMKNSVLRKVIGNKIREILLAPEHFKPLMYAEQGKRRVHILKCFFLTDKINAGDIYFIDFDHHDRIYNR